MSLELELPWTKLKEKKGGATGGSAVGWGISNRGLEACCGLYVASGSLKIFLQVCPHGDSLEHLSPQPAPVSTFYSSRTLLSAASFELPGSLHASVLNHGTRTMTSWNGDQ
jgi:hypothetical protein